MTALTRSTASANRQTVQKAWIVIDADGLVVGRLASLIANRLRGKHKTNYTPHVDCGDYIIVINAEKVRFTGAKAKKKIYYRHTSHVGGIKEITAEKVLAGRFPERVLEKAVERMIPRGPLGRQQMRNLRVFSGPNHPHDAQSPRVWNVSGMNEKNSVDGPRRRAALSNQSDAAPGDFPAALASLWMQLDDPNDDQRADALSALARLLPAPTSQEHFSLETSMTLRALPMRLMRSLIEDAKSPVAAKAAALALVKAQYPQHYHDADGAPVDEAKVAEDFQRIFRRFSIDYFCTFDTSDTAGGRSGMVNVDSRVWNGFSFELDGRHPTLGDADWIDPSTGISVEVVGAKVVTKRAVAREALQPGQLAGCVTQLVPDVRSGDRVRLYLLNGERVLEEHVFTQTELFGRHAAVPDAPPKLTGPREAEFAR